MHFYMKNQPINLQLPYFGLSNQPNALVKLHSDQFPLLDLWSFFPSGRVVILAAVIKKTKTYHYLNWI